MELRQVKFWRPFPFALDGGGSPAKPGMAPKVALVDRPEFLTWPHVEEDGVLCLLPDNACVDFTSDGKAGGNRFAGTWLSFVRL